MGCSRRGVGVGFDFDLVVAEGAIFFGDKVGVRGVGSWREVEVRGGESDWKYRAHWIVDLIALGMSATVGRGGAGGSSPSSSTIGSVAGRFITNPSGTLNTSSTLLQLNSSPAA